VSTELCAESVDPMLAVNSSDDAGAALAGIDHRSLRDG
jgi:hypothetical protein